MLKDEMEALSFHKEYLRTCESVDKTFDKYLEKLNVIEIEESKNICVQNKKLIDEMQSNIEFFDAAISKMNERIEVYCINS